MTQPPTYDEHGTPTTLARAANDALDWLTLMARLMDNGELKLLKHAENRQRLQQAMDNLKTFIEEDNS